MDFFAVVTYVSDYYMKDESGTTKGINEALAYAQDENLMRKMNIVKNEYFTRRQAGECEVYYKMFPFLHLSHSNIVAEFIPTGFKQNRYKFLKQVPENAIRNFSNIITVEGKDGKYYIEKESVVEKYLRRPACLNISLAQFVKRYSLAQTKPKKYSRLQFFKDVRKPEKYHETIPNESDNDSESEYESEPYNSIDENDIVFDGTPFDPIRSIPLPPYIPLERQSGSGGIQWMRKRSQKSIRFHKYNKLKDTHEWHYSELLLYLPFHDEEELYPNDFNKCLGLYVEKFEKFSDIKSHVMPHLDMVIEAREKAEEFISTIGEDLDSNKEQENEEAEQEGAADHPDLNFKDSTQFDDQPANSLDNETTFRQFIGLSYSN